jgi:hypothetical protein
MPITLVRSREVTSRRTATTTPRTTAVEALHPTRSDVGGPIADQVRKAASTRPTTDIVEEWGMQSFPASDPPMNW